MPYEAELLYRALSKPSVNSLPYEARRILDSIDHARAKKPGAPWYFAAKANELFACVTQAAFEEECAAERAGSRESQRLVAEALQYVQQHYTEPLTLESIAQALFVSRARLAAVFKEETGKTLGSVLRHQRMTTACDLLVSTRLSIAEIARAVGYAQHASFAEAFKAHTGISPSAWRAQRS